MEEWRSIKDYEGLYEISNIGRVSSVDRTVSNNGGIKTIKGRLLKLGKDGGGYQQVFLCKEGKVTTKKVHRLVAETFIPNPENKPCIDHINTVRTDNRVENLRWCTHKENQNNPITNERMKNAQECKPVAQYTLDGELIAVYPSLIEASRQIKCSYGGIRNCCNGGYFSKDRGKWVNMTKYNGYVWKYFDE